MIATTKNYVGLKFGDVEILSCDKHKTHQVFYKCHRCGSENWSSYYNLKKNKTGTCGCAGRKPKPATHDLSGQTFGYIHVIQMVQDKQMCPKGHWLALCECKLCGKQNHKVRPEALRRGMTTTCGCGRSQYEKISGKNHIAFKGHEDIRGKTLSTIKKRAERRDYSFDLEAEWLWELYLSQNKKCALSGQPIWFRAGKSSQTNASLDRIDSNQGYTKNNVQWVLKDVNIMKNTFEMEHFLKLCVAIANNQKEINAAI